VWKKVKGWRHGLKLNYRQLVQETEDVVQRIWAKAEVDMDDVLPSAWEQETYHNIAGSQSRFNPVRVKDYDKWDETLSMSDRLTFALMGGHFWNKYFGA
jgi:hypothetical protein